MRIIDLTYTINENISLYPGARAPKLETIAGYKKDGYRETLLTLASHTATHIDAPAHVLPDMPTLESMDIAQFAGSAALIDCADCAPGASIGMRYIRQNEKLVSAAEFLVFRTGWAKFWGSESYAASYPHITPEIAEYLASSGKKGIGLDTISVDPTNTPELALHKTILGRGNFIVIENMANLDKLSGLFTLLALPIKFKDADGAPARVVALV